MTDAKGGKQTFAAVLNNVRRADLAAFCWRGYCSRRNRSHLRHANCEVTA